MGWILLAITVAVIGQAAGGRTTDNFTISALNLLTQRAVPDDAAAVVIAGATNPFLQEELGPRLEQARRGRRQVFFVDAAHFVLAPFLGCLWCAARLFVRAASGRKRYNVLGALDAVTHRLIRVTNDGYINAESVCALLRQVAA